jgi:hypothetical protein
MPRGSPTRPRQPLSELVVPDLVEEGAGALRVQELGGLRAVAAGALEGLLDEASLEDGAVLLDGQLVIAQVHVVQGADGGADVVGQVVEAEARASARTMARSMTFSSSRTLPVKEYSRSTFMASGSTPSMARPRERL